MNLQKPRRSSNSPTAEPPEWLYRWELEVPPRNLNPSLQWRKMPVKSRKVIAEVGTVPELFEPKAK